MAIWKDSAYYRKRAPAGRKWRNKHTGIVGSSSAAVLNTKRAPSVSMVEPTGKNLFGDDSIARAKHKVKTGKGFAYSP
jgi:hypothetical protein